MRILRETAINGKKEAGAISDDARITQKKRIENQEIAEWITIWLQSPEIFENWIDIANEIKGFSRETRRNLSYQLLVICEDFTLQAKILVGQTITLNADETKHLRDVLRLHEGEKISVFDGTGTEFLCEIEKIEKQKTLLKIVENIPNFRESALNLTLAVALLKGEKFDLVVQKACELGVSDIIPLITKRADVKIKDKKESDKKLDRWQRISLEAAKQCGRSRLMQIEEAIDFKKFVESSIRHEIIVFRKKWREVF